MAALYYIIAREIDSNPQVLFRLRGMDLSSRFGKSAERDIAPPFKIKFAKKEKTKINYLDKPFEFEDIPHCGQLITSLLPSNPPFCNRDFSAIMAEFYHHCGRGTGWESEIADNY